MRTLSLALALAIGLAVPAFSQTLDRIRETGQMNLGYRTDAAPLSFANEDGLAAGYSSLLCATIVKALAEDLGIENLEAKFVPVTAEDRFEKVANGEIDLLCGAASITLERREIVDFSDPTFVDGAVMLLPRNASTSLKDLAGKRIGVHVGTTTAEALANTLERAGVEAETVPFESHDAGVLAVMDKQVDAYFADQSILVYQLASKGLGGDLRLTNQLLTVEKQGLAMARGDSDFRLAIDSILSRLYRSGAMRQIYAQTLPGVKPGAAMQALHLIAPTLP